MSKNETPAPHIERDIQSVRTLRDEDLEVAVVGGGTLSGALKSIGEGLTKMASKQ